MKAPDAKFPNSDDSRQTADMAWRSVSTLAAGMLLYGGLGWLVGRLVGWLVSWLVRWWVSWLVGWLVGRLVGRLVGWLTS
jgi:F0F1-type ATP synthase assembly protein I